MRRIDNSLPTEQPSLGSMRAPRVTILSGSHSTTTVSNAVSTELAYIQPGDSLYPTGHYLQLSLSGTLGELYPDGLPEAVSRYAMFRFRRVELFCTVSAIEGESAVPNVVVLAAIDLDDSSPISWEEFRTRQDISIQTLTATEPFRLIASWVPVRSICAEARAMFPELPTPDPLQWSGCTELERPFLGLKLHMATLSNVSPLVTFFAKVDIEFS